MYLWSLLNKKTNTIPNYTQLDLVSRLSMNVVSVSIVT